MVQIKGGIISHSTDKEAAHPVLLVVGSVSKHACLETHCRACCIADAQSQDSLSFSWLTSRNKSCKTEFSRHQPSKTSARTCEPAAQQQWGQLHRSYSSALGLLPNRLLTRQCWGGYTNVRQQLWLPLWAKAAASPPSLIPCTYRNKMLFCDILLSAETMTLLSADLSWSHWLAWHHAPSPCETAAGALLLERKLPVRSDKGGVWANASFSWMSPANPVCNSYSSPAICFGLDTHSAREPLL